MPRATVIDAVTAADGPLQGWSAYDLAGPLSAQAWKWWGQAWMLSWQAWVAWPHTVAALQRQALDGWVAHWGGGVPLDG